MSSICSATNLPVAANANPVISARVELVGILVVAPAYRVVMAANAAVIRPASVIVMIAAALVDAAKPVNVNAVNNRT